MTVREPLPLHGAFVTALSSTGYSIHADVTLDIVPGTAIVVRHLRVYHGREGWKLSPPNVLVGPNEHAAAITLPPSWRPAILAAVLEAAQRRGLVKQAVPA